MATKHLRALAQLLNNPDKQIRSVRQHKPLASHLALLYAARFLPSSGKQLTLQPTVANWLHAEPASQVGMLLQLVETTEKWSETLSQLKLQETITEDYTLYLCQSLTRLLQALPIIKEDQPAAWQKTTNPDIWQLNIPQHLPLWLQFDLRQLGDWTPASLLTCTPLTIATAVQRGYGPETMQWLLETATQRPLPEAKEIQLHKWSRRAHTYRLRTVHLLSTAQDRQLAKLLRRKAFRNAVIEHIAPRHAIVAHDITPRLEKYLAKQQYPLSHVSFQPEPVNPALVVYLLDGEKGVSPADFRWIAALRAAGRPLLAGVAGVQPIPLLDLPFQVMIQVGVVMRVGRPTATCLPAASRAKWSALRSLRCRMKKRQRKNKRKGLARFPALISDLHSPYGSWQTAYSVDALRRAWQPVRANKGGSGSDGQTITQFETDLESNLERLHQELISGHYQPQPVKQILVPKANSNWRPHCVGGVG